MIALHWPHPEKMRHLLITVEILQVTLHARGRGRGLSHCAVCATSLPDHLEHSAVEEGCLQLGRQRAGYEIVRDDAIDPFQTAALGRQRIRRHAPNVFWYLVPKKNFLDVITYAIYVSHT